MSSGEERSEQATPRRRAKSQAQGMRAYSALAGSALAVAAGAAPAVSFVHYLHEWPPRFGAAVSAAAAGVNLHVADMLLPLVSATLQDSRFWGVAGAAWGAAAIVAAAAALACGSLSFAPSAIAPRLDRISGRVGLRRLPCVESLIQTVGAGIAVIFVAIVSIPLLMRETAAIAQMHDSAEQIGAAAHACALLWWRVLGALVVVAAADVVVQRRRHDTRLKMSMRELREERAQTEGRPEAKQRRRSESGRRVRSLRIAAIRRATAVIANPTHLAIALRYAPPEIDVPTVVARGADLMVPIVCAAAHAFGVPVVESPELARLLYDRVDIDEPIPEECYAAVAAVFTWIIRTRGALRRGDEDDR